jgi:hypothetical protein
MKLKSGIITGCLLLLAIQGRAQDEGHANQTDYRIEAIGSASTGETTPFWIVSNRYGVVPLESGNGVMKAGVFHHQELSDQLRWSAGLELAGIAPRNNHLIIQQLYAELDFKVLRISLGSKERYHSILNKRLSSGDLVLSPNARPIPEINLSIPQFTPVPFTNGYLQVKGDFAVGKSFDADYLEQFSSTATREITYVTDILWHHKSAFIRLGGVPNRFPLSLTLGLEHWAQWGGKSTDPEIGRQPQSLKDFLRIIFGKEGGEGATASDMVNVLGNHFGSYYFALGYNIREWGRLQAYHQHYFEDMSGVEFANGFDGLWGIELETSRGIWLKKIVVEHLITKNQSGPMHFILFDREKNQGRGGGNDDYYNNGEYRAGNAYFNRATGSPLILSPEYNKTHEVGFQNNRVNCWHLGAEGDFTSQISYRILVTAMKGWGTSYKPFLNTKSSVATLAEITYTPQKLNGWQFGGALAIDTGDMVEKNTGFSLYIRKQGILKKW